MACARTKWLEGGEARTDVLAPQLHLRHSSCALPGRAGCVLAVQHLPALVPPVGVQWKIK